MLARAPSRFLHSRSTVQSLDRLPGLCTHTPRQWSLPPLAPTARPERPHPHLGGARLLLVRWMLLLAWSCRAVVVIVNACCYAVLGDDAAHPRFAALPGERGHRSAPRGPGVFPQKQQQQKKHHHHHQSSNAVAQQHRSIAAPQHRSAAPRQPPSASLAKPVCPKITTTGRACSAVQVVFIARGRLGPSARGSLAALGWCRRVIGCRRASVLCTCIGALRGAFFPAPPSK